METKLIKLEDGTLIEVEIKGTARQISGGIVDKVNGTFDKIQPILVNTCRPVVAAWRELNADMQIEQAEIEIGFSFEGEGNIYITKAKASSNLKVKLVLKSGCKQ
jgi:Trypsin-co-occurring domain 1